MEQGLTVKPDGGKRDGNNGALRNLVNMLGGHSFSNSLCSFAVIWALASQLFSSSPLQRLWAKIKAYFNPKIQIKVTEQGRDYWVRNKLYNAVETYLRNVAAQRASKLRAGTDRIGRNISYTMDEFEEISDIYQDAEITWGYHVREYKNSDRKEKWYEVTCLKKYRNLIFENYFEHVMETARAIDSRNRERKLYTNSTGKDPDSWCSVVFKHPATIDTLAMDQSKKKIIINDLVRFSKSKDYYAKMGKAWKRGYLLYGPPGTGKSTMIASIANFLDYDIYDLELTSVKSNTDLRRLLMNTTNKSILVIEDIDCSIDLTGDRKSKDEGKSNIPKKKPRDDNKITLSGLLNFIDGLWSASAEERIVVFTTNHPEKLDPALVRTGRMDMHIEMSYCSYEGFTLLAKNYLDLDSNKLSDKLRPLFAKIRELLDCVCMTPADVAELLMCKTVDSIANQAETQLQELIKSLEERQRKMEEAGSGGVCGQN